MKWIKKWNVQSHSGNGEYIVSLDEEGNYGCSCPVWKFRRIECKHILEIKDQDGGKKIIPKKIKSKISIKPLLAPNEQPDLNNIEYPIYASYKLDGYRCLIINGELFSRSLKPIQNEKLWERFKPLMDITKKHNVILDGEIYGKGMTFQEIGHFVMTQDTKNEPIPLRLKYYAFDLISDKPFDLRYIELLKYPANYRDLKPIFEVLNQVRLNNKVEVENEFKTALNEGYEGLILKSLKGRYKYGRATINENIIYKVKPYKTFDAKIIDITQATKVKEGAERKINELGYSKTSTKKDDRILINKAACFRVEYEGKEFDVSIALSDKEKEEIWINKKKYIGKMIEYKAMLIGAKDVPRHGVFLRYRYDKNDKRN